MTGGFGKHFTADLYFCQNEIWKNPRDLFDGIYRVTQTINVSNHHWSFQRQISGNILISWELNEMLVLLQVFPAKNFLAMDIFCWESKTDIHHFSEGLMELFAPQLIAAETGLRAEHLN